MAKVEKRAGSYTTRVSITDPDTGERIQKRITARTKKDLDRQVTQLRAEHQRGEYVEPDMTPLADWLETWHGKYKARESTRYQRWMHIRVHLKDDKLGRIPLGRLRYHHVQDWVDRKLDDELSASYVRNIAETLKMALEQARRRRLISVNPCVDLVIPGSGSSRRTVLSEDQARTLVDATRDDPDHAFWVLAVVLGIRRGELLGLRWDDYDPRARTLRVERTMTRTEGGQTIIGDETKTSSSQRVLRLPDACVEALTHHRTQQLKRRLKAGELWADSGAIFDSGLGEHWITATTITKRFVDVRTRLEFPTTLRPHDLRHTAATHMIRRGIPIPTVAKILGHANPAITMRVYAHVLDDMEEAAVEIINTIFQPHRDQIVTTAD